MPGWGMIIEPKKHYKQTVKKSYRITHAVLSGADSSNGTTELVATIQGEPIVAAVLNKAIPQVALDLQFSKGENIALSTRGAQTGPVHLTGYILDEQESNAVLANGSAKQKHKDLKKLLDKSLSDEDSDDMDYSQLMEDYDGMADDSEDGSDDGEEEEEEQGSDDDEMGDDSEESADEGEEGLFDDSSDAEEGEEEEQGSDEEEEEEEEEVKPPPSKKKKDNAQQQPQQQQQHSKKDKKKEQQQQAKKEKPAAEANGTAATAEKGKMVTLAGGIKYKDLKEGTGAFAKPGKNIVVYYEGRLQGKNKVFDSCKQGAGFKFALGRGAVIRGWDQGIAGMRVGGKRQLICPPNAAYGAKGSPPVIPPNSTLVFDVELRNVN